MADASNRNQMARFGATPAIHGNRSKFPLNHEVAFSANVGDLIPVDFWEVLPGDSFRVRTAKVCRFQTLLTPIFGNAFLDVTWWFIPNRLLWDHFKNFMGESDRAWTPSVTYSIPKLKVDSTHRVFKGSIADYLGVPPSMENGKVNALPFRAYGLIVSEWWRDQNYQNPIPVDHGDADQYISDANDIALTRYARGGYPFKANKFHDIFTSVSPQAQKGPAITLPNGYVALQAPLTTSVDFETNFDPILSARGNARFIRTSDDTKYYIKDDNGTVKTTANSVNTDLKPYNLGIDTVNWSQNEIDTYTNTVYNGTITQLRQAFQIQKLLEADLLGGTRYREILRHHFNCISPDASQQVPQYLGGNRVPIVVNQIVNTGENSTSNLGNVGAMSVTTDSHEDFVFSSTEHGLIMCLACLRYQHQYSQGLHRYWSKDTRYDFYWPELNNISLQPVYIRELDARYGNYTWTDGQGVEHDGNRVWGYNEAWYDYRYIPDRVAGELRPGVNGSLLSWTVADYYQNEPQMGGSWLHEDKSNFDRVLAVTSNVANQYWADFYFDVTATRPMSLYSVPGLADHY